MVESPSVLVISDKQCICGFLSNNVRWSFGGCLSRRRPSNVCWGCCYECLVSPTWTAIRMSTSAQAHGTHIWSGLRIKMTVLPRIRYVRYMDPNNLITKKNCLATFQLSSWEVHCSVRHCIREEIGLRLANDKEAGVRSLSVLFTANSETVWQLARGKRLLAMWISSATDR